VEILNYRKHGAPFWNQLLSARVKTTRGGSPTASHHRSTSRNTAGSRHSKRPNAASSWRQITDRDVLAVVDPYGDGR
jgi:hypothetical protein